MEKQENQVSLPGAILYHHSKRALEEVKKALIDKVLMDKRQSDTVLLQGKVLRDNVLKEKVEIK